MSARLPASRPPRRRISRRRYMARRAVAGVLLIAAVVAVVRLGAAVFGGDGRAVEATPSAGATNDPTPSVADTGEPADTDETAGTAADTIAGSTSSSSSTSSTSSTVKPVTVPSAERPAVLYIAGDSDAGTFGPYLEVLMDQTGMVDTTLDYKVSSGLARPDFFDWPQHFDGQLPKVNPDIVVVTFGGNDGQGLSEESGEFIVGQPNGSGDENDVEWRAEYGRRVGEVMDLLSAGNRTLIWVGIPNHIDPAVTARMQVQDQVVKAEAAKRPDVLVIDSWARFSGRNGGYGEFVIDPRDGVGKDVRSTDGFHLNETGAEILALDIAEAIRSDLRARGAQL